MTNGKLKLISLFTGCGGLDLGFEKAGFKVVWANEFDKSIWQTIKRNFPHTKLDKRSIVDVPSGEVPEAIGIIGGPPCQSWSEAGALRGIKDERGKVFFEFMRLLSDKHPLFFLAENVSGMLAPRHAVAFKKILRGFEQVEYKVNWQLLNVADYGVPQDRHRIIFVGYHEKMGKVFEFPQPEKNKKTLRDAIGDLQGSVQAAKEKNRTNGKLKMPNHEHMNGGFSTIYMSRNRVRSWGEQSFTIQAGGRHAPIHPQANKMIKVRENKFIFDKKSPKPYRRLSVRECARVQTFPDDFIFEYGSIVDGYKMIGNAVPVEFARHIAQAIHADISKYLAWTNSQKKSGAESWPAYAPLEQALKK